MNATGPWRTDIKNAPNDRDVLLCFRFGSGQIVYYTALSNLGHRSDFVAWAEINRPDV